MLLDIFLHKEYYFRILIQFIFTLNLTLILNESYRILFISNTSINKIRVIKFKFIPFIFLKIVKNVKMILL